MENDSVQLVLVEESDGENIDDFHEESSSEDPPSKDDFSDPEMELQTAKQVYQVDEVIGDVL